MKASRLDRKIKFRRKWKTRRTVCVRCTDCCSNKRLSNVGGFSQSCANLSDQFTHACAHFTIAIASYLEGNLSGVKAPVSPRETGKEASSRSVERDARRDVSTGGTEEGVRQSLVDSRVEAFRALMRLVLRSDRVRPSRIWKPSRRVFPPRLVHFPLARGSRVNRYPRLWLCAMAKYISLARYADWMVRDVL